MSDFHVSLQSSDSTFADDPVFDIRSLSHGYTSSASHINSYAPPSFSSSLSAPDEYDSVMGDMAMLDRNTGVNPFLWLWKRKGRVLGHVKSGVSNAARSGLRATRSVWTWASVLALTAGSVKLNQLGMISECTSESDDESPDHSQELQTRVDHFMG